MKILLLLLLFGIPLLAYAEQRQTPLVKNDQVYLYFNEYLLTILDNRILVDSAELVTIKIFSNIKNIKTVELTDYYAKKNLCKDGDKTNYPVTLAKFAFDPKVSANNLEFRIHMLCANKTVSYPNIIRLDIDITTGDNRAIHKDFTMIIKMNSGIYGTNNMDGYN